jgi:hypothetical protein
MLFDDQINQKLNALKHLRKDPAWSDFFNKIDKLEKLAEDINDEMHNDPSDTTKLDAKAKKITTTLENNKDKIAGKTKNKDDYDSVYNLIGELVDHFNYTA